MKKVLLLVAAGIGVGLLMAPRKGSETWRRIVDGLDDLKNYFLDDVDNLKESGKDAIQKGKREVTEALNEGNRTVSEAVQEW
jgi:gas vesicle protein